MATVAAEPRVSNWTVADLFDRFGPILLSRIRFDPAPGTATEDDVIEIRERETRLFELVDGVLIEKTYDLWGSYLAALIAGFMASSPDGIVLGADGMARLAPGLIRIPDLSFIPWERFPGRVVPREPMVGFAPDLAVEVLSPSNTVKEMDVKLRDYFRTGVRLVWYVDPEARTVRVFTGVDRVTTLDDSATLDGGDVLPGWSLAVGRIFERLGA
jgi:Uma2 family endonuclease